MVGDVRTAQEGPVSGMAERCRRPVSAICNLINMKLKEFVQKAVMHYL